MDLMKQRAAYEERNEINKKIAEMVFYKSVRWDVDSWSKFNPDTPDGHVMYEETPVCSILLRDYCNSNELAMKVATEVSGNSGCCEMDRSWDESLQKLMWGVNFNPNGVWSGPTWKYAERLSEAICLAAVDYREREDKEYHIHKTHCFQGEYEGSCKYGDNDCPASSRFG